MTTGAQYFPRTVFVPLLEEYHTYNRKRNYERNVKLRETRNCIAYAYRKGFINDREFVLLYDANRSKNPDFPYWNYERFELDELTNAECNAEFRFYKHDIYKLADALQLPD